jgi:hypothetical protein
LDSLSKTMKWLYLGLTLSDNPCWVRVVVDLAAKLRRLLHLLTIVRLLRLMHEDGGCVSPGRQLCGLSQLTMGVWQLDNCYRVNPSFRLEPSICLVSPWFVVCNRVNEIYVLNGRVYFNATLVSLLQPELRLLRGSGIAVLRRLHQQLLLLVVLDVSIFIYVGLFAYESWFKVHHYWINKIIKRLWQNFAFKVHWLKVINQTWHCGLIISLVHLCRCSSP